MAISVCDCNAVECDAISVCVCVCERERVESLSLIGPWMRLPNTQSMCHFQRRARTLKIKTKRQNVHGAFARLLQSIDPSIISYLFSNCIIICILLVRIRPPPTAPAMPFALPHNYTWKTTAKKDDFGFRLFNFFHFVFTVLYLENTANTAATKTKQNERNFVRILSSEQRPKTKTTFRMKIK